MQKNPINEAVHSLFDHDHLSPNDFHEILSEIVLEYVQTEEYRSAVNYEAKIFVLQSLIHFLKECKQIPELSATVAA